MDEIRVVKLNSITVGEHALRVASEDETISDLVESIRRIGIIVPLVVQKKGSELHLVAGHRRYAAALSAGFNEVPVIEKDVDSAVCSEIAFAENVFRKDLSDVEIAAGMHDIINSGTMKIDELAAAMHRSTQWVAKHLTILQWPDEVQAVVHSKSISTAAASNLAMVEDEGYRKFLIRNAVEQGATARVTAAWLQAWRSMQPAEVAITAEPAVPGARTQPMVPQAPCLVCSEVFRTDELSHVPICAGCIRSIRNAV